MIFIIIFGFLIVLCLGAIIFLIVFPLTYIVPHEVNIGGVVMVSFALLFSIIMFIVFLKAHIASKKEEAKRKDIEKEKQSEKEETDENIKGN